MAERRINPKFNVHERYTMKFILNPYRFASESLLLDTYTGAAAAYSLRKLRTAYTGYCVKVRRASDDATQDIDFVNNVIDTATLESFCSGTDGFVDRWYDQSGNNNNALQSTTSYQPQIVSSGSIFVLNSKPYIKFNVSNVALNLTSVLNTSRSADTFSVFSVWLNNNRGCPLGGTAYASIMFWTNFNSINSFVSDGYYRSASVARGNQSLTSTFYNYITTTESLYVNGDSKSLGSLVSLASVYEMSKIGTRGTTGGTINNYQQEILFWGSDQSSNRTAIETNINNFYSIY